MPATILSQSDVDELRRVSRWTRNFRGHGVTNTPHGATIRRVSLPLNISVPGSSSNGSSLQRYRVKSEGTNSLVCRTWDGATEGSVDVDVAKPPQLRGSISIRTVGSEDQEIFPSYTLNDEIWAATVNGGTGVTVLGGDAGIIDINVDSRRWVTEC